MFLNCPRLTTRDIRRSPPGTDVVPPTLSLPQVNSASYLGITGNQKEEVHHSLGGRTDDSVEKEDWAGR